MSGSNTVLINIPGKGAGNFKQSVPTLADLPTTGNSDGDVRVVLDINALYVWDDGTLTWVTATGGAGLLNLNGLIAGTQAFATGSSGTSPNVSSAGFTHTINIPSASTVGVTAGVISNTQYDTLAADKYKVERFTLTPTDITNKFITLAETPTDPSDTRLIVIGGGEQEYGIDFSTSGTTLTWNGLGLDGVLISTDDLIVVYN
jgi:hypothetical protein